MADQNLLNCIKKLKGVFIFAADIVPTDEPAYKGLGWRSGRATEEDKTGPAVSYERVLAAAVLYRINPSLVLVPSGGKTNVEGAGESPPIARVVAFELEKLGVPPQAIVEEPQAFNAWEQIVNSAAVAVNRKWGVTEVGILAPIWQFGRISAMILTCRTMEVWPFALGKTTLISMERALASEDADKWNKYFAGLYARPEMQKTLTSETMGTGQLLTGHQPKYPQPFRGFSDPLSA